MGSGDAGATAPMTIFASIGMNGDWAGIGPVTSSTGSPYGRGMRGHGSALADTSPLEPGWKSDTAPPVGHGARGRDLGPYGRGLCLAILEVGMAMEVDDGRTDEDLRRSGWI